MPGNPTVLIGNMPALTASSRCLCAFGGMVTIVVPGQFTVFA